MPDESRSHAPPPNSAGQPAPGTATISDGASVEARPVEQPGVEPTLLAPVTRGRVESVDLLRGIAVLGILAMNIYAFAMPFVAYGNPLVWGGTGAVDMGVWYFTHLVFDQKFMSIFSMLFGAGLVLMHERAGTRSIRGVWYRRQAWLLVIGALHGYLLWFGDILFTYAVIGMLIYPLRKVSAKKLVVIGSLWTLIALPLSTLGALHQESMQGQIDAALERREAGEEPSDEESAMLAQWEMQRPMIAPTEQDVQDAVDARLGTWREMVANQAPLTFFMQVFGLPFFLIWRVGGLMMLGMGLMKLGIFSATRDERFYRRLLAVGYGLGVPLGILSSVLLRANEWDMGYVQRVGIYPNYIGSVLTALGHVGLIMLAYRRGWFGFLRDRFVAVGRMAFTNYLVQTLICTLLFNGYGLGLFGSIDRAGQMGIVLAIWIFQLWLSPLWLAHMRFGPAEWLWRSLTYGRRQPMRR